MEDPRFLTVGDIEAYHDALIAEGKSLLGYPHPGALESACVAAINAFNFVIYRLDATEGIPLLAAYYWYHISQAHAFSDANKRTAFLASLEFLSRNGYRLDMPKERLVEVGLAVAKGEMTRDELALVLAPNIRPL